MLRHVCCRCVKVDADGDACVGGVSAAAAAAATTRCYPGRRLDLIFAARPAAIISKPVRLHMSLQ